MICTRTTRAGMPTPLGKDVTEDIIHMHTCIHAYFLHKSYCCILPSHTAAFEYIHIRSLDLTRTFSLLRRCMYHNSKGGGQCAYFAVHNSNPNPDPNSQCACFCGIEWFLSSCVFATAQGCTYPRPARPTKQRVIHMQSVNRW